MRSHERQRREEQVIAGCLSELIAGWREQGQYVRMKCIELLFVQGRANKDVAARLGISEQDVANHKSFVVRKLMDAVRLASLPSGSLAVDSLEQQDS